ncbi:MAG: triose-phosphate isomerase [Phycisphaerae bacterium]|nr:triose-phosphate isomerase [Phycisphaerae bacterium]
MMRKPFVAGNWKMNMDGESSIALVKGIAAELDGDIRERVDVAVCPPFVYLAEVVSAARSTGIAVGAQDLYFEKNGAFTGEISTAMLKDVGCNYVLCGHSERRHVIGETDELINKKVTAAISGGLLPILCVGELLEQRDAGKTEEVVEKQIRAGLAGLNEARAMAVTIAYEPVWAIGTGRNATPQQAQEVHAMIRGLLAEMYGQKLAEQTRIQYGGSAKPDNAGELLRQPDIDGLLVGGASLKADSFAAIFRSV